MYTEAFRMKKMGTIDDRDGRLLPEGTANQSAILNFKNDQRRVEPAGAFSGITTSASSRESRGNLRQAARRRRAAPRRRASLEGP